MIDQAAIRKLHKAGFLRQKYFDYHRIYNEYESRCKSMKSAEAISSVGIEFGLSQAATYKAIKAMKILNDEESRKN